MLSLLLSCFACSNVDQEAIYSSALAGGEGGQFRGGGGFLSAPGGKGRRRSGLSGTLVVSIPLPSLPLEQWADRFMEAHPGVKITIDCLGIRYSHSVAGLEPKVRGENSGRSHQRRCTGYH